MENNLSKAIKFPVRYEKNDDAILDADGESLALHIGHWEWKQSQDEAFGHALAEMINGLGRGNLQEGWISVSERLPDSGLYNVAYFNPSDTVSTLYVLQLWRGRNAWYHDNSEHERAEDETLTVTHWQPLPAPPNSKPDRQVKSAEDVFQSKNGGKDSDTSVEHGETFTAKFVIDMMEIYAQQYK